jgi:hypothetical protein
MRSRRSSSPTDHAWNGQPIRRVRTVAVGDFAHVSETVFVEVAQERSKKSVAGLGNHFRLSAARPYPCLDGRRE